MFSYQSASLAPAQNEQLYALVDCAIDVGIYPRIAVDLNASNHANLFSGAFAGDAEKYSPVLIDLEHVSIDRQIFMQKLMTACEGKPLLSFVSVQGSLDQLADHLRKTLTIKTADDQEFLLRYSDNRMLPAIFSVLTDVQQHAFLGPVSKWFVASHHPELKVLTARQALTPDQEPASYPLQLDEQQLALLLDRTELYSLVSQLEQLHEPFSEDFNSVERIRFVERNTKQACDYGFNDAADKMAWCVGALHGGEDFYMHSHIVRLFDNALDMGSALFDAIAEVSQENWLAVRANQKVA